jgi:hypothetical protein
LNFAGGDERAPTPAELEWLGRFSELAGAGHKSLLGRYRLLDVLLQQLTGMKAAVEESLTARSPLQRYEEAEKELRDKWEEELTAAIEAEYRRQRVDLLGLLQRWLRDIWLRTLEARPPAGGRGSIGELLSFPQLPGPQQVAGRISSKQALENLQTVESTQRLLYTNVQEALALEVGLLKLHL